MNKNVPKIRFQGFHDDWEQRKLGCLGKVVTGNTPKTSEAENWNDDDSGHVWITPSDISSLKTYDSERHLTAEGWGKARQLPEKSVLITSIASIGKNTVNEVPAAFNQQINAIIPKENDADFILNSMINATPRFKAIAGQTATAIINKSTFEKFEITVPKHEEQKSIGQLLNSFDMIITLHQRKLNLLQEQKKSLLQKMFPKKDEKIPEIRFNGFTDDWEQRKLEGFSDKTFGGGTPKTSNPQFWNGSIPWIQSSDLKVDKVQAVSAKKHITEKGLESSATKLIPKNSIAIVTRVGVGKLSVMPYEYATSQDFLSLSYLNVEINFAIYAIYRKLMQEAHSVQGTSIKGITKSELLSKKIATPSESKEQEKIGSLFERLDNLITLHQRKLDALQEQKKGLLQKMFV